MIPGSPALDAYMDNLDRETARLKERGAGEQVQELLIRIVQLENGLAAYAAEVERLRAALQEIADYGLDNPNCAQVRAYCMKCIEIAERALDGSG